MAARVALATCAEVPELDEDGPALRRALERRGIDGVAAVWDAPTIDWRGFDLVVVRSTWDYAERRGDFLSWADSLPRVANPADVLRWNTDKRYLRELARAGVRVVPTRFLEPDDEFDPPGGRFVVKPAVSAGGRSSASYGPDEAAEARDHVHALTEEGRTVMIQPYLDRIDEQGETALVYLDGVYSHAIAKGPLLPPGQPPGQRLYLEETIDSRVPRAEEVELGAAAMAALPFDSDELLYGRVDLVAGDDAPLVLEVELTEPSLYLSFGERSVERLADGIARRLPSP